VAQTRKKRQTKHRGNAAGIVESRGRTGRKPTDVEKAPTSKMEQRRRAAEDRRNKVPTWRGAANRAAIAALLFIVSVVVLFDQDIATAVSVGVLAFLFYVPLGYYVDLAIYKRNQRKKAAADG
jgi:hypothetical protein